MSRDNLSIRQAAQNRTKQLNFKIGLLGPVGHFRVHEYPVLFLTILRQKFTVNYQKRKNHVLNNVPEKNVHVVQISLIIKIAHHRT